MNHSHSQTLFDNAKNSIPGGVNSPVRAFKAVGGNPVFFKSAKGAFMYDVDGNAYTDYINSWGPMILGHAFPKVEEAVIAAVKKSLSFGAPTGAEVDMAELICSMVPSIEKVRMVNSGTEATMSAIRLARGFTKRDKIIKFEGCYHGHGDSFLIAAGSGAVTMGSPDSPGVTQGTAKDTLTARFNDLEQVQALVEANKNDIAAIILEPVAGNMGCVLPNESFLEGLRQLCDKEDIVLIFDEVMTGFRLSKAGAQGLLGVQPDLTTFGKVIGGGMPVGAYGGRKDIMSQISPEGPVYQAGTLSGNPVAMAAGFAMLTELNERPEIYQQLENTTKAIVSGIQTNLNELGLDYSINQIGSMFSLFFTSKKVEDFEDAKGCNLELFGRYFREMLDKGIYLAPSQFETLFISSEINEELVGQFVQANKEVLVKLHG